MAIQRVISFGFKHPNPPEESIPGTVVVDVRSLFRNPYRDQTLRPKNGLDPAVVAFVLKDPNFASKYAYLKAQATVPGTDTVYIGCTGGRHRSVVLAERLGHELGVPVIHRDIQAS